MEVKELRIGNYVHHNKGWSYRCGGRDFDFIWNESDWHALGECTLDLSNIKPIPLTEEWLVKFGFDYVKEVMGYADSLHLICNHKEGFCFIPFCTNDKDCHIILKHVHQLQNLYFALTGEELKIKQR